MVTVAFVVSFSRRRFRSCKQLQTFLYVWVVWCLMFRFWSNWIASYLYKFVSDRVLWWCTTSSVLLFVRCDVPNSTHPVFPFFKFTISWFSSNQVATGAKSSVRLDLIKFVQSLYKLEIQILFIKMNLIRLVFNMIWLTIKQKI